MPRHFKNTRATLEKQRAVSLLEFKKCAPEAYDSFIDAEESLRKLGTPSDQVYAELLKNDPRAITECLKDEDRWMTRREIANTLHKGGYRMDPKRGVDLLVQNIGKNIGRGIFQEVDGKTGLLEWIYPDTM